MLVSLQYITNNNSSIKKINTEAEITRLKSELSGKDKEIKKLSKKIDIIKADAARKTEKTKEKIIKLQKELKKNDGWSVT